ncbi:MAG: DUF3732 domain-containing protein [Sedimenticola sp.]
MRAFIRHIGVVDQKDKVHSVSFGPGVNVVTGKSSTGKSALIEIFDYCFGSSDFTIPDGVITSNSEIYFVVINVTDVDLVLARRKDNTKAAFLKPESDLAKTADSQKLTGSFFDDSFFIPLTDFKRALGRYFGLRITDVEESSTDRQYRGQKKPRPSIRSFTSFMLQHQNLVANKHALFYRFDEREKRDQVIEHLKIFLGFSDQQYFIKAQELDDLRKRQRLIELRIPKAAELRKSAANSLDSAIREYHAVSGHAIDLGETAELVSAPAIALEAIRSLRVQVTSISGEQIRQRDELERKRARQIGELREEQRSLSSIHSSIEFAKRYTSEAGAVCVPESAKISDTICPFCKSSHEGIEVEANELSSAITWLNDELRKSTHLLESFEEEELKAKRRLEGKKAEVLESDQQLAKIDAQIEDLEKFRTQHELALKAKLRAEAALESLLEKPDEELERQLEAVKSEIKAISKFLRENYDVKKKLETAESSIDELLSDFGSRFDFEESYRPINLRFSLETFDLWYETEERKVFLRSMGSGANWLYCHLALFLALHRYFASLGNTCSIPSILFFDQPSQVYFPSILDNDTEFSPEALATKEGQSRKRSVDEDIVAVTNLYSQLVRYCAETKEVTGIEPQIIVTDHADNLDLEGETKFEDLVQGRRWRTRGFIQLED